MKTNVPLLTERLQATLDKLSAPTLETSESISLKTWWQEVQSKYAGRDINFSESIHTDPLIPIEVFNTVTENLLDNARSKRMMQPDLSITVTLQADTARPYPKKPGRNYLTRLFFQKADLVLDFISPASWQSVLDTGFCLKVITGEMSAFACLPGKRPPSCNMRARAVYLPQPSLLLSRSHLSRRRYHQTHHPPSLCLLLMVCG